MTPDDLLDLPDGERQLELVAGRVRERHKGMSAAPAGGNLMAAFHEYADPRGGWVFGWGLGYRCFADANEVRRVTATYLRWERMPAELRDADVPFLSAVPDIAADTRVTGATVAEVAADTRAWLAAGVAAFWDIDVAARAVRAFHPDGEVWCLGEADTLTTPLLPGFRVPVADLFRRPGG